MAPDPRAVAVLLLGYFRPSGPSAPGQRGLRAEPEEARAPAPARLPRRPPPCKLTQRAAGRSSLARLEGSGLYHDLPAKASTGPEVSGPLTSQLRDANLDGELAPPGRAAGGGLGGS